jgi:hypothetical protein
MNIEMSPTTYGYISIIFGRNWRKIQQTLSTFLRNEGLGTDLLTSAGKNLGSDLIEGEV